MWSKDKIAAFAPDKQTFQRANALASSGNWKNLAGNERIVYGNCKSSGVQYYKSVFDLQSGRSYCSCPSSKNPCKHLLALLLIFTEFSEGFAVTNDFPEWVRQWLERATRKAVDPSEADRRKSATKMKNREKRIELMQTGNLELLRWLSDIARGGIAAAKSAPGQQWEDFAALMVDAKMGSIARKIRLLEQTLDQPDGYRRIIPELAELYLFARGFENFNSQPPPLQDLLLQFAGFSFKKSEVIEHGDVVEDTWLVMRQMPGQEDNLNYRRTWLIGEKTSQIALLLDFSWGGQPFEHNWPLAGAYQGKVYFYPGGPRIRGLFEDFSFSNEAFQLPPGITDLDHLRKDFLAIVSQDPWRKTAPYLLKEVTPLVHEQSFYLSDVQEQTIPLAKDRELLHWKIVAISGGYPVTLFGEWSGFEFLPLTLIHDNRLILL